MADKTKPLPRGYRVRLMTDGRPHPALLIVHGKVNEAFKDAKSATSAGHELADKEREFGREVRAFDVREWRRYLQAKAEHFGGKEPDWPTLALRSGLEATGLTVSAAVERYKEDRKADGLTADTMRQMRKKLERLVAVLGNKKLHEVTVADAREWMAGIAKKFQPWTVVDHHKIALTFWTHARREKWCLDNPFDACAKPKVPSDEINVLTVAEAAKLFEANRAEKCVGRLALEAFGGLRASSAGRLLAADIKWTDSGIELPGSKHKSGRRHYIDGLPDNLWAWLKAAPAECWQMSERQYATEKAKAFTRAKVTSTPNCLRHSFATYHVAGNKDAALTAVLMQHTSPAMLWRHYKGRGSVADGKAYFAIVPLP